MQIKAKVTILFPGPILEWEQSAWLIQAAPASLIHSLPPAHQALRPVTDTAPKRNAVIRRGGWAVPLALCGDLMIT